MLGVVKRLYAEMVAGQEKLLLFCIPYPKSKYAVESCWAVLHHIPHRNE